MTKTRKHVRGGNFLGLISKKNAKKPNDFFVNNPLRKKKEKTFEILFVRHALSCANLWKERVGLKSHLFYPDPELTSEGIQKSIAVGETLKIPFGSQPFTIGASVMLRAQQTAYLMFAKRLNKPLFIVPYIGEIYSSLDNKPNKQDEQRKDYQKNPEYTGSPSLDELVYGRGINFRSQTPSVHNSPISSYEKFLEWIQQPENDSFFAKGSDGIYRAILVTHSGFMAKNFPYQGVKKYNNNDALFVRIIPAENKTEVLEYLPAPAISSKEVNNAHATCPDKACRRPPPCGKKGGKQMTKRRRRRS